MLREIKILLQTFNRDLIIDLEGFGIFRNKKLRHRATRRLWYSFLSDEEFNLKDLEEFLNFPDHCTNHGILSRALSAYLSMSDYSAAIGPLPTEDVPLFVSTDSAPERQRFLALPDVANSFKEPSGPPSGMTLAALIESLGAVTILNLAKGDMG